MPRAERGGELEVLKLSGWGDVAAAESVRPRY